MIWTFVPKHILTGTRNSSIEIATFVAVSISNEGCIPILKILDVMGITIGPVAMRLSRKKRNSLDDTRKLYFSRVQDPWVPLAMFKYRLTVQTDLVVNIRSLYTNQGQRK